MVVCPLLQLLGSEKEKLDFQLVLWTSNYHNFLAWGHFLLVLVGDLVRRFMESKVWRPLSWQNKKNTQSAKQRSACLKFVKKHKSLTVERGRDDYLFLDQCPKYFFYLPNVYCLGVEMAPAQQVIKKLKMNHLGLYKLHVLSHSRPQLLQSVKKKKKTKKKQREHAGY